MLQDRLETRSGSHRILFYPGMLDFRLQRGKTAQWKSKVAPGYRRCGNI
jgi:hypothetical protein